MKPLWSPTRVPVFVTGIVASFSFALVLLPQSAAAVKRSQIRVYNLANKSVKTVYTANKLIEAPNWSPDGSYLLVNTGGDLWKLPLKGERNPELQKIDLGGIGKCNNDHGISPDGKLIVFSSSANAHGSQIYKVASSGGKPQLMVPETPSYFHGFSPDGKWFAIVSKRNGNFDLFRMPVAGGDQKRLTSKAAYDDGPDYSPDGKWIYFNSDRSGSWDIWRMPADGAGPGDGRAQQVTKDDQEDWFPHCSPDGKWLVFLTFPKGTSGHDSRLQVELRMIPLPGGAINETPIRVLTKFFGGQGTINVNSWSPDSREIAFVSYEL